jgi:predicted ester cyclase
MGKRTVLLVLLAGLFLALAFAAGWRFAIATERSRRDRNKELVRRMHADVWSEPDKEKAAKAMRELYSLNVVVHDWTGEHQLGLETLIANWEFERSAFRSLVEHAQAIVAEGDLVVDRFVSTGTQAHDLGPIPGHSPGVRNRGKTLRMAEMEMFRVVDGKLAEQWLVNDIWGAHEQLGLFDPDHWHESICSSAK